MDPTRVARASVGAGALRAAKAAPVVKGAAAVVKGAAAVVKRKRGALQDISNSHPRGAAAAVAGAKKPLAGVSKPPAKPSVAAVATRGVKRSASSMSQAPAAPPPANVRVRGARANGAHANVNTKRRRANSVAESDHGASTKVQTKLLSFKSIGPATKTAKREAKPEPETKNDDIQEEAEVQTTTTKEDADPEMECHETLKTEPSQPEPTASAAIAIIEVKAEEKPTHVQQAQPVAAPQQPTGQVPPYEPRPYVFKFDHRDSGFDEETYRSQIRDIDEPFRDSAIHCVNIVRDMDRFHRQHQDKYHPTPDYLGNIQVDINEKMRTILIDWLVEVGEEYELDSQTFHKTVNLVDRCLATFKINRKQFQLLGCACMMIAAKFEEVYGPNVEEFVYISDQTYTSEEMLEMEMKVLQALEYRIASTTCHGFLPRFTRAGCNTDKQKSLVQYLCDFAMLYYHMLEYRPSMLAAAAVYLSRLMTNEEQPWTPTLHHVTQFNAWELKECVMDLYRLHHAECAIVETERDKAKAVSEKYVSEKFHGVSATPSVEESMLEQSFLAYEQPLHMRRKLQQESASASGSAENSSNEE